MEASGSSRDKSVPYIDDKGSETKRGEIKKGGEISLVTACSRPEKEHVCLDMDKSDL